jgi:hypothetical protein
LTSRSLAKLEKSDSPTSVVGVDKSSATLICNIDIVPLMQLCNILSQNKQAVKGVPYLYGPVPEWYITKLASAETYRKKDHAQNIQGHKKVGLKKQSPSVKLVAR